MLDSIATDELARVRFAAETLAELRAEKDRLPIAELIHKALERTGYDAMLLAEFLGERKLANLHKLIEQARQFDAAGIFTLADFIVQLSQFVARQPDEPLAATQPESINAVRLMSIHQSKGLEFPVVVVVDLDRPRVVRRATAWPSRRSWGRWSGCPNARAATTCFSRWKPKKTLAELTRLLYVAATRAGDYLILSGGLADLDRAARPVAGSFAAAFRSPHGQAAGVFGHGAADPLHGASALAKVILEEPPLPKKFAGNDQSPGLVEDDRQSPQSGRGRQGRLCRIYLRPVAIDRQARRQYSVSRLHGTLRQQCHEPVEMADDDAGPSVLDPLGLGTLVHAVLADLVAGKDDSLARD